LTTRKTKTEIHHGDTEDTEKKNEQILIATDEMKYRLNTDKTNTIFIIRV